MTPPLSDSITAGWDREPTSASRRVPGRKTRPLLRASQHPRGPSFPDNSKQKFLVDTGAAVSVLPHSESAAPSGPPLTGADGKTIPSWGSVTRTLSFGMRTFFCTFIPAPVSKPILGTDFLSKHCLLVNPAAGQVLDAESLSPVWSNLLNAAAEKT